MDLIDMTCELDKYKVLALPMVYMFKEGFAEKVCAFVENGGVLITSYWSGIAVIQTDAIWKELHMV